MSLINLISQNAFSSIVIDGLVKKKARKRSREVKLTCTRSESIPADIWCDWSYMDGHRPDGIWIRPPSKLPAPGNETLCVTVKDELGQGRVGSVYSVDITPPKNVHIPPLVIKVSDRYRSSKLAREAWFYEEMEHLQGVSIARCYGFFQVELTEEYEVPNWRGVSDRLAEEADEEERNSLRESVWSKEALAYYSDAIEKYGPNPEDNGFVDEFENGPDPAAHLAFVRRPHLISVLVLERLGNHLPFRVPLDGIEKDVYEIHEDLASLGIQTLDVHWRNILAASDTSERLICPYHGHTHSWRVIDFDLAIKTNYNLKEAGCGAKLTLAGMFKGLMANAA